MSHNAHFYPCPVHQGRQDQKGERYQESQEEESRIRLDLHAKTLVRVVLVTILPSHPRRRSLCVVSACRMSIESERGLRSPLYQ